MAMIYIKGFRKISLLAIFLVVFLTSRAQSDLSQSVKNLTLDIGALAHDSMFGREAGTPAELNAARYIEEQFMEAGLKPYHNSETGFLQPFEFGDYSYGECKLTIDGKSFIQSRDFGAIPASANGSVFAGNVIEFNPGLSATEETDVPFGKLILMINLKKLGYTGREGLGKALQEADTIKASALLLYNADQKDFSKRLFSPDSLPASKIPVFYVSKAIAASLTKGDMLPVSIKAEIKRKRKTAYNVIGFMDNGASRTVVIGGHFDHVGVPGNLDPKDGDPNIHNGADDNASGTAAVIELARQLKTEKGLKYNYMFIAFTGEEKGLYGSAHFCNSDLLRGLSVAWMLNLDMVGRFNWNGKKRVFIQGMASSKMWKPLIKSNPSRTMKLVKIKGGPAYSDHYPFLKHGIPVLYFTTGLEKEYHKPADDANLINYEGEAMLIDYMKKLILDIDKSKDPGFRKVNGWQHTMAFIKLFIIR